MKIFKYFDIEFQNVELDEYFFKTENVKKVHHACISAEKDEIELRIFYNDKTYLGEKILSWIKDINRRDFGSYIKVTNEKQNQRLQKLDLSDAKLNNVKTSSSYYHGNYKYVVINIDTAKFYWNPVKEEVNTAEFYMHDTGFRVVKPFYSPLFGYDDKFDISRMEGMDVFYKLEKSEFRPEFNTFSEDNKENRIANVIKEPKIQFKYNEPVTESEAVFYGEVVRHLASFYHHIRIDYSVRRIHLPEYTIVIVTTESKIPLKIKGNLWGFKNYWDFHSFLLSNWQTNTLNNFKILSQAIELFNQAILVDKNSEFLIRYNLIEICNNVKQENEKFKFITNKKNKANKFKNALKLILEIVNEDEQELFKKKWNSLIGKLEYKPIKSPLVSFLENQNLNISEFPITISDLKILRDRITHGSISKVDSDELRRINIFLYRLNGILILNLMGINEWKLDTKIEK
jgi:hypothetical protein